LKEVQVTSVVEYFYGKALKDQAQNFIFGRESNRSLPVSPNNWSTLVSYHESRTGITFVEAEIAFC
jgi:hypothetical protein